MSVGCWRTQPPLATANPTVRAPAIPRASFEVAPADLGGSVQIKHRARIWRHGTYWTALGRSPSYLRRFITDVEVLPVIAATRDRLRVVVGNDQARLALWIDRRDAEPSVRVPVQLAAFDGRATAGAGAWVEPGARVAIGKQTRSRVEVHVVDDRLAITGWVPAVAIGTLWVDPSSATLRVAARPGGAGAFDPPSAPLRVAARPGGAGAFDPPRAAPAAPAEPRALLADAVAIVERPARGAGMIARSQRELAVDVLARHGDWVEIAVQGDRVRVRGFVAASAVRDRAPAPRGASAPIALTSRPSLPSGTCLYSGPAGDPSEGYVGEVIGVTVEGGESLRRFVAGWWVVEVYTPWGPVELFAHDEANAVDLAGTRWERCTPATPPERLCRARTRTLQSYLSH